MKRIEKQVVAYTSVCHALDHIFELAYGVVLIGIAQEFGVGLFLLGVLANITGFAFGLASLPSGFLADRIGERRLLMIFCLGSGLASITVGLSPNIYVLGVALAVLGLVLGIYHPVGSAFVSRATKHRGMAFGYLGVGGNLGVALGPILAGAIASTLGWRAPYLIFAIPAFLVAGLLYSFTRTKIPPVSEETAVETDAERTHSHLLILPLALIFVASAVNGFVYRGLITFLPLYLSQRLHFTFFHLDSMALAGSFTTVALIFGVLGQFLGGYLSERRRHEVLALVVATAVAPLLLLMGKSEGLILMLAAISFAFFHFMGQPVYNNLIADYSPASWRGRSYGIGFFCTFGLGSFSATLLGYTAEQLGTNWVFIVMAGIALITLACIVVLLVRALTTSKHNRTYPPDNA
ncbi:Multidrug resistance protein MdtG [subsurface metagenome]